MESDGNETSQNNKDQNVGANAEHEPQNDDTSSSTQVNSISPTKIIEASPGMSKNQMKKMLKNQRWMETKAARRAHEKQKKKEKRKALKESGAQLPPNRKVLKRNCMKDSSCTTMIAIDCSFDDLMGEKDINKVVKQLNYCYASNRRMVDPAQFYITSFSSKTKCRMEEIGDYKGWDVYFKAEDYVEVFGKDKIVYLTSDSPNVLAQLEDDKAYIIGGLVDHNHQKGLCHRLALEKGIAHAQLPIGDYLALNSRKVLTINHVFEILLEFTASRSWEDAFYKVIPCRKVEHFKNANKTSTDATDKNPADDKNDAVLKDERKTDKSVEDLSHLSDKSSNDEDLEIPLKIVMPVSGSAPPQQEASLTQQHQVAAQSLDMPQQQQHP